MSYMHRSLEPLSVGVSVPVEKVISLLALVSYRTSFDDGGGGCAVGELLVSSLCLCLSVCLSHKTYLSIFVSHAYMYM